LIDVARAKSLTKMIGVVLANNHAMLEMVANLGFTIDNDEDTSIKRISLALT
jgi:hypothetical protein